MMMKMTMMVENANANHEGPVNCQECLCCAMLANGDDNDNERNDEGGEMTVVVMKAGFDPVIVGS